MGHLTALAHTTKVMGVGLAHVFNELCHAWQRVKVNGAGHCVDCFCCCSLSLLQNPSLLLLLLLLILLLLVVGVLL